MRNLKVKISKWLSILTILTLVLSIAGCGGKAETESGEQQISEETVDQVPKEGYVPETLTLDAKKWMTDGDMYILDYSTRLFGDDLYYIIANEYNEEAQKYGYRFYRYSIQDGTSEQVTGIIYLHMPYNYYDIGEDGSIYASYFGYENPMDGNASNMLLTKFDAVGEVVYDQNLLDLPEIAGLGEIGAVREIFADREGEVCLVCEKRILLFDQEGGFKGSIDPCDGRGNASVHSAKKDENGNIWFRLVLSNGKDATYQSWLRKVDLGSKSCDTVLEDFAYNGPYGSGVEKTFLVGDFMRYVICDYDPVTQEKEDLLRLTDHGYTESDFEMMGVTSEGKIVTVMKKENRGEPVVLLFSKALMEPKVELVLGTAGHASATLRDGVAKFNRGSDKYHVTIKDYLDGQAWSDEAEEEAWSKMMMELTAGTGPDLVDVSLNRMSALVDQGYLEDLTSYVEGSAVAGKGDFVDNVLEAASYNGYLAVLPKQFQLLTVVGKSSDVGADMGWSREEFETYVERNPKAQVLNYPGKEELLWFSLGWDLSEFLDRGAGKCHFDSPEFIRLLEFADRYGGTVAEEDVFSPGRYQRGEILLSELTVMDFEWIQLQNLCYKDQAQVVGYPTADGSANNYIAIDETYGIAANSRHKEGAWAFLEFFVNMPYQENMYAFPALKSRLEEMVQEEIRKVTYELDEDGERILDENGEPVARQRITKTVIYGEINFDYYAATAEEVERTLEIIRSARPRTADDQEIRTIIDEEAEDFFYGSKSAAQVADVIQRRAQLYLNER